MFVHVPDAKADGEAQRELPKLGIEEERIMSELKAIESATAVIENVHLVYIKAQADKVIAELKAREDVLVTDNRNLLDKVKKLENHLRENAEHFKRNEAQILESSDNEIKKLKAENERLNRELEHVKNGDCINTCDVVEKHVKEELKAKRAPQSWQYVEV